MTAALSKSDFLLFLRHPAWLWLKRHAKSKLPAVTENEQAVFDAGYLFESYAEKLFPEGVRIGFDNYQDYRSMPARTRAALEAGASTIFQGRFESGGITCICDVVTRRGDSALDLYEIKSSTRIKDIQISDLAFQLTVLQSCGYRVGNIFLLDVNRDYVRRGDIDPLQLVRQQDITRPVRDHQPEVKKQIARAFRVLQSPDMPDISPSHCRFGSLTAWLEIYRTLVPVDPGSIYDLCRLNPALIGELESRGISRLVDIPDDFKLNSFQFRQVSATRQDKVLIDREEIHKFLSLLVYPLYFLDYETLSSVVPLYDGQKPYQQVPFQYSLHVLDSPEAEIRHFGYLHTDSSNPVLPLTASLQSNIGDTGSVLVWHQDFEKTRNTEMGCTDAACFAFYDRLNRRIVDLMTPFSSGWYIHRDFLGSASIKKVLPVLVPRLSYHDLDIQEGGTAQRLWMETVIDGKHPADRDKIFYNLDEYCLLDTLAMVEIFRQLVDLLSS